MSKEEFIQLFIKHVNPALSTDDSRLQEEMDKALAYYPPETLADAIKSIGKGQKDVKYPMDIVEFKRRHRQKTAKKNNLIEPGVFYYHSDLHDTSPLPQTYIDPTDGKIKEVDPDRPYWLEMKKEYTLEDALAYFEFYTENKIREQDRKKALGALRYFVDNYGIDVVLHAIEIAQENYEDYNTKQPTQPIHLSDHMNEAIERLETRVANAEYLGLNKIIPRPV